MRLTNLKHLSLYLILLFNIFAFQSYASEPAIFSKYSKALTLVEQNPELYRYRFNGPITIRGLLVIQLDMASPTQASGDIINIRIIPTPLARSKLPAIIHGRYTSSIDAIFIHLSDFQLNELFAGKENWQRLSHGTEILIKQPVEVTLNDFSTSVECDSRTYTATINTIAPITNKHVAALSKLDISGC